MLVSENRDWRNDVIFVGEAEVLLFVLGRFFVQVDCKDLFHCLNHKVKICLVLFAWPPPVALMDEVRIEQVMECFRLRVDNVFVERDHTVANKKLVVHVFFWNVWDRRNLVPHHNDLIELSILLLTKR